MELASLFLHNAAIERDRVEYGGLWTDEQKETIEAAFDVLVDDPAFAWRHGQPRVPRIVDGGYNNFLISRCSNDTIAFKRFTWDSFKYFDTVDDVVDYIAYLHRPLSAQGDD